MRPRLNNACTTLYVMVLLISASVLQAQQRLRPTGSQSANQMLEQATAAISAGDLASADTVLQKVLRASPRNVKAHTLAGIVADKRNDIPSATEHFALAAKFLPATAETHNNYGAILLRSGKTKEAASEFEASLRINPNQLSALVNLARIRFEASDLLASRALFEKARGIQNDADIARSLLIISLRLRDHERIKSGYQEFSSFSPTAAPTDSQELARLLIENGFGAEAAGQLEGLLASEPANIDVLVLMSQAYLLQKNVPAAGKVLESAVARGIDDARVYAALADVYQAGGYFQNAIPAMRLAVEKDRGNIDYRYRYGLLLIDSKAPAAAAIRLNEYVKEFPQSAKLWLALGIAYSADGNSKGAGECFDKALAFDPKMLPALAYAADTYAETGRYDDAAKLYQRGIDLTAGKEPTFHYLLADTLLNVSNSDPNRIETLLKRAIELDSNFGPAYSSLGTLYVRQSRWGEAATALERAVLLLSNDSKALYQLSRVYARLKKTTESQAALEKFKRLDAEQKEHTEADRRELVRKLANVRF